MYVLYVQIVILKYQIHVTYLLVINKKKKVKFSLVDDVEILIDNIYNMYIACRSMFKIYST